MDPWEFRPPVLVGERVVWLGSGSGIPQGGVVKWIGKMPEMGPDWTVGMELDTPLPYGGIDGTWGSRHLFACKPKHGLIVPIKTTLRESDLFQKPRQSGSGSQHGRPAERAAPSDQPKPAERARKPQLDARKKANAASHVSAPPRRKLEPQKSQDLVEKQKLQEHKRLQELLKIKEQQELELQRRIQELQKLKELQELQKLRELQEEKRIQQQLLLELEKRSQQVVLPEIFAAPLPKSSVGNADEVEDSEEEARNDHGEPVNPRPAIRRRKQPFPQRPTRLKCSKLTLRKASDEGLSYQCHTIAEEYHQSNSELCPRVDFPPIPCGLLNRSRCETIEEECQQQSSESTPKRVDSPPPPSGRSDLSRCDTLRSIASGDYQWYDAFDKVLSESTCVCVDETSDPLEADSCDLGTSDESTSHECANGDIMNGVNHVDSSYEETIAVTKQLYSEAFQGDSLLRTSTSNHSQTGSGSRKEKVNSGFFSFLRWFQKKKEDGGSGDDDGAFEDGVVTPTRTAPSSPRLHTRSHNGSSGSVNSVFSTATVSSFSFVSPTCYRPFGDASQPEKCIAVGQDTDTYRNRLKYRDRARELDRNLTLKKKYRLYASDSVSTINTPNASPVLKIKRNESVPTSPVAAKAILAPLPGSQNSSFGRNKRRAPAPPNLPKAQYSDYSLPSTLENKSKAANGNLSNGGSTSLNKTHHRRTASESSKDKKAGAYCHVKGKRKAPAPPATGSGLATPVNGTLEKQRTLSFGRKKRPAPLPPSVTPRDELPKRKVNKESQVEQLDTSGNKTTLSNLSPADRDKLMSNIAKLQAHADRRSMGSPPASPHLEFRASHHEKAVCNDTLKLERGVLKSNKEMPKVEPVAAEVKVAPCSPRPWYKRSLSKSDSGSSIGGGLFKSLEKKKDRDKEKEEEWMPEVGIARSSVISVSSETSSSSRFNIFSKLDWSDDKKKDGAEKRKSQVSMLANISELDREAAAIVQKEHARENAILEAQDAKFYSFPPDVPDQASHIGDAEEVDDAPKRSSARELISLFNAIGNVTRVTVNTSFFAKDGIFTKEGMEKRFSFIGESSKVEEQTVISPAVGVPPMVSSPGAVKKVPPPSGVVIEEVEDEQDRASRARALYEANRSRRHRSPSPNFPTIEERSESASSKATTPLSTIQPLKVAAEQARDAKAGENVWTCPRCTLENPQWKVTCDVCSCWRPSASGGDTFGDREDPVERPTSPLPFIDQEREIDTRPVIETVKKPVLDWEMELKRYFPDSPKIARAIEKVKTDMKPRTEENRPKGETFKTEFSQSVNAAPALANAGVQKGNPVTKSQEVEPPKNASSQKSKYVGVANPSNFIGGRNKADESKSSVEARTKVIEKVGNGIVGSDLPAIEESDVDELRKARLAFFHRPSDRNGDLEVDGNRASGDFEARTRPAIDENERSKLREMLKEMKNSLPKRPKNTETKSPPLEAEQKIISAENRDLYKQIETSGVLSYKRNGVKKTDDANKHGAIKKVPTSINEPEKENMSKIFAAENGTSSALFITKTTVYENIKVKKVDPNKPAKVSTSVQTSAVVRKIEPTGIRHPTGLPPSHPNLPSNSQEASAMYKSLSKDARRIGTFELIRARDFKSIEATKTRNEIIATHVYANMPDESPPTSRHPKDLLPQQPSAPEETLPKTVPMAKAVGPPELPSQEDFGPPQSPLSLVESSDQWSSATGSPVPQSPDSRRGGGRGSKASSVVSEASSYSASSFRSGDNSEVERLTAQLTMPKGLADFKANLQTAPSEGNNMNTLAVNRLLRRLEAAIAGGQHAQAAGLARDLARQKISCSVTRQRRSLDSSPTAITVDMYVEDKVSHQGPIPLQVTPTMTVAQLKQKVEQELEIPVNVQRWILGKLLASDDSKTLADHNVNATGCPMFLYLVAPDGEIEADSASASGSNVETLPAEEEEEEGPMQFPAPPGKGWYYNYEEDHYSLCEDSEDDLSEEEVRVLSNRAPIKETPATANAAADAESDDEEFEEVDEGNEEEDEDEEEEEMIVRDVAPNVVAVKVPVVVIEEKPVAPPEIPRLPEAYNPVAGGSRGGLAAPRTEEPTGTLKLGWQCPVCTLVNAPTRPGCAACTTARPENYIVPTAYRANKEEGLRLEREQQLEEATAEEKRQEEAAQHQHYMQLVNLDKTDLVPNTEAFDCSVCLAAYGANEGTVLRECLHTFCRPCLVNTVLFNQEAEVKCPYRDANYACDSVLQEREIKALVPKHVYEQHLAKSVAQAENKIGNAFHCKTPDCRGWCIFEDNLNEFHCPVCVKTNCLTCQAIHIGINCKQYQEKVKQESETNIEAKRTKDMLEDMVYRGEAMKCPTCQVILMKKWGCDWLRCSMCKTEICWVTRGPRWGPGGKGDTTGGCQCGLNGFKCHPRCNYCH